MSGSHTGHVDEPPLGLLEEGEGELGDVKGAPEVGVQLVPDLVDSLPVKLPADTQTCSRS